MEYQTEEEIQIFKKIYTFENFKLMMDQITQLRDDNESLREITESLEDKTDLLQQTIDKINLNSK